jgi:phosphoribosylformimino-5-aminoimidazole carboxamide ribotide isomerase
MILFPAIDLHRGRCVRLRQGRAAEETVYDEDPAAVARRWADQGAEWLHVVNLDGAFGQRSAAVNLRRLAEIRAAVPGLPIQFGGGLRSLADVETALRRGANRAILGTAAVHDPELVAKALARFGPGRIVVAIDARDGRVATHGWCQTADTTATELGRAMGQRGVHRAIYTDISRDGMLRGLNITATEALARESKLRVIASGGVASLDDVKKARSGAGIEGIIIGQALYQGLVSLDEAIRAAGGGGEEG